MPKVDSVASLITAVGSKDMTKAKAIIQQMISHERYSNKENAARKLEIAFNRWPEVMSMTELPRNLRGMMWEQTEASNLSDLYLDKSVRDGVEQFINERENAELLRGAHLPVSNCILLAGPPGNGKTTLASAVANKLGLPFLVVKMHMLIDSHVGETGRNVGAIFEHAINNECVLFLDEFDAIGTARQKEPGSATREFNNIVNTLLVNMDRLPDASVLIVATNMKDAIDEAILRRFDTKIWLDKPTLDEIELYVDDYQNAHSVDLTAIRTRDLYGESWSAIERLCVQEHKKIIIGGNHAEWVGKQRGFAI